MAARFEDLINGMVNVGFGVAATASEKGREVLKDLNARGERARADRSSASFAQSMSDAFEQAGGVFSDVTARLASTGDTAAERVLDELILARVRPMDAALRIEFIEHVRKLVGSIDDRVRPPAPARPRTETPAPAASDAPAPAVPASGGPVEPGSGAGA